jgi:hypothetical protein
LISAAEVQLQRLHFAPIRQPLSRKHGSAYKHQCGESNCEKEETRPQRMSDREHNQCAQCRRENQKLNENTIVLQIIPEAGGKDTNREDDGKAAAKTEPHAAKKLQGAPDRIVPHTGSSPLSESTQDLGKDQGVKLERKNAGKSKPERREASLTP